MTILKQLQEAIENGHLVATQNLVEEALQQNIPPEQIVEEVMAPAMRIAGEKYNADDTDTMHVLVSANCIKKGLSILEASVDSSKESSLGTVILGTVEGDLHDVGKNLVSVMFKSAGFKVIDLGIDISEKQFLSAVRANPEVSIVCISSLLTTAVPEMEQIVKSLRRHRSRYHYKIMVGGGAVSAGLAEKMGADAYTENCIEAVRVAKSFIS